MKEWVTFFEVVQSGIMVYPLYILLKHKIKCPMAVFYTIIACLFILLKNRLLGLDRYNLLYDLLRWIYDFLNTFYSIFDNNAL